MTREFEHPWTPAKMAEYAAALEKAEAAKRGPASSKQVNGDHYKSMAIQPSEYIHRNGLNWCEGNAIKYITRHKLKGGRVDIEKAIHYLELLLELEYPA
jgi:hypothetical protein